MESVHLTPLHNPGVRRARSSEKSVVPPVTKRDSSDGSLRMQGPGGEIVSIAGFTNELRIHWFFSVIGTEYCHTYFWIAKDIAWMQGWRRFSILFGMSAIMWSFFIMYHTFRSRNWHELWNFVALFMWLFSNYWWMAGEAHDLNYPHEPPISDSHEDHSSYMLSFTLLFFAFFYVFVQPCKLLPISPEAQSEYDDGQLRPRLPWLDSFRQYENLHMLFWVAKDLAWNRMNFPAWVLCMIPTLFISADLLYISSGTNCEDSSVDIVHFVVVFIWVVGNSLWALGDFVSENDSPVELLDFSWKSFQTPRWTSSWILMSTIVPLVSMYSTWYYLTLSGKLLSPHSGSSSGSGSGSRRARRHFTPRASHSASSDSLFQQEFPRDSFSSISSGDKDSISQSGPLPVSSSPKALNACDCVLCACSRGRRWASVLPANVWRIFFADEYGEEDQPLMNTDDMDQGRGALARDPSLASLIREARKEEHPWRSPGTDGQLSKSPHLLNDKANFKN